ENDQNFEFEYKVGFAQAFELKIDKKTKVDRYTINIDDQVINETVENLQRQFGEMENAEIVSENDTIYGSLKTKDGSIDKEISVDLRDLEASANKKIVGTDRGTEINLDWKKAFKNDNALKKQLRIEDQEYAAFKGKATFKIDAINHYKLAAINQELYDKSFGEGTIKDEETFRERIKKIVTQNYSSEEEQFFNYKLREEVVHRAKIILPDDFLKEWLLKTNEKMSEALLATEYEPYSKELRWSLVRNQIAEKQDLKVEHEEVVTEAKKLIKKQFAGSGIGDQMDDQMDTFANNYLQGENGENYMKVYNQVQNDKAITFLTEQITVKEKKVSLDEFRRL
ncbi:MAG: trigger factor, partial [Bacteroidota bacterium]